MNCIWIYPNQCPRILRFTVDLRDPPALCTTQRFQDAKRGGGSKSALLSQTFDLLKKGLNKTNVQTHWVGHRCSKEEVCV